MNANIVGKWVRHFSSENQHATPDKTIKTEQQLEIERLRRELAKATTERNILRKAVAHFAKEPK